MFPKRIKYLLTIFDLCGFYTETSSIPGKNEFNILLFHISLAILLTIFIFLFATQPRFVSDASFNMVNNLVQFISALITYWMIVIESFYQRKYQRRFWQIYWEQKHASKPNIRIYLFIFIEYTFLFTAIQLILMHYFSVIHGVFVYFLFTAFVYIKFYQYRIFYYIFYMKLVQENLRLLEIQFNVEKQGNSMNKHFNLIRKNYQRVHEMISCLNHTFGWSQFFTILFSFHILLTELNWSYWGLHKRSAPYKIGFLIFRNIGNSIFNSFFWFQHSHCGLCILY